MIIIWIVKINSAKQKQSKKTLWNLCITGSTEKNKLKIYIFSGKLNVSV